MIEHGGLVAELVDHARDIGGLQIWVFGSALRLAAPRDIDIAAIYDQRRDIVELRSRAAWELASPPIDLIGLTVDEELEFDFLAYVGARRLL